MASRLTALVTATVLGIALSSGAWMASGCQSTSAAVAAPPEALITRLAAGDQRDAALALRGAGKMHFDEHQDDGRDLLRPFPLTLVAAGAAAPANPTVLTVNRAARFQTMQGYGAAMTDASAALLNTLQQRNPRLYEHVMARCFSPTTGAGFSVLRVTVGSSDFTAEPTYFTHCDQPTADLSGFSIDQYRKAVIPQILAAQRLNPALTVIATPWSAPAWMKTNGKLAGISGDDKDRGATNRLKPECFEIYADYLVRFVREMRAAGVALTAITLQNEPQFDSADYPCLRMDEAEQVRLAGLVAERAASLSPALSIFVHDHNAVLHPDDRAVRGGDKKMEPVDSVTKMLTDPVGAKAISGSAWHWYSGNAKQTAEVYETLHARFPDKRIAFTEGTGWGFDRGQWFGTVDWGMAHAWMTGPQHWAETCLMWNLFLDDKGAPTLRNDSKGVGLGTVDATDWVSVCLEREFYALAHMSRAAQPGAQRIGSTVTGNQSVSAVAFEQRSGRIAVALFNRGAATTLRLVDGANTYQIELPEKSVATCSW